LRVSRGSLRAVQRTGAQLRAARAPLCLDRRAAHQLHLVGPPLLRGRRNNRERPNDNDWTRTHPAPQDPHEQRPKNGPENSVNWSNGSGWKEGMLGDDGEFAFELFHDLRATGENPATGGDLDNRILGDVLDPVRAPPVGRADDESARKALAGKQDSPGQTGLPAACCKENPARRLLEVAVEDLDDRVLRSAEQHGDEVEASSEGFSRHRNTFRRRLTAWR